MKIGIMTFWWSDDNYGQILQCYALQKYLRDAGHDAYLIRYDPRNDYVKTPFLKKVIKVFNPVKLSHFVYYKVKKIMFHDKIEKTNYLRKFDCFRKQYMQQSKRMYYSYKELIEGPPEADVYIAGSDQVWNPDLLSFKKTKNQVKAYFLDFGDGEKKRIAYAASFGKERLPDNFIQEITILLEKFDYVSVREKSGLDICRACGFDKVEWVPDPTMLLKASDYRALYANEPLSNIEKSYCLLYMLSNTYDFSIKVIYEWAKSKNLEIVYVTGNLKHDKYEKMYASIPEWLYLIDNAEYIITNSFHCSLFSLLFQKRFGIVPLTGSYLGMNSRFDSLFETMEIRQRFIDSSFTVLDTDIDWNKVENIFKTIQNSCNLLAYIQ
ncbi:MAG: polysaccharide pyruvyl transferase family protein [Bacteroidales bacterium]|jgi:hypothetical protein|nr:polysaccharide pyruvyl transferase family protein [Bacteroidales bacterium]